MTFFMQLGPLGPRSPTWRITLALLGVLLLDARCQSAEPEDSEPRVAFTLSKGWVEMVLQQNGQPLADALLQISDERGKNFADGQTDPDGKAAFPRPPGSSFTLEIKAGKRTADPIRLFLKDGGIEPARVLLSYGLRPCCRFLRPGEKEAATPIQQPLTTPPATSQAAPPSTPPGAALPMPENGLPVAWRYGVPLAGLGIVAALFFMMKRRAARRLADSLRIAAPLAVIGLVASGLGAFYLYRHRGESPAAPPPQQRDLAQEARADLDRRNVRPLSASLQALLADPSYQPIPTQTASLLLQPAPDFTLQDAQGKAWSLATQLKAGPVILVFYYGYYCNHCVSQLFALDRDLAKFRELGATVVALSADTPALTRERFRQYGAFGFPVLADPGNTVARQYETYLPNPRPNEEGDLLHGTFVISRQGQVVWVNRGDGPFTENHTLLVEAARAEGRLPDHSTTDRQGMETRDH